MFDWDILFIYHYGRKGIENFMANNEMNYAKYFIVCRFTVVV